MFCETMVLMADSNSLINSEESSIDVSLSSALESERQSLKAELIKLREEECALLIDHSLAKLAYRTANPGQRVKLDMSSAEDRRKVLIESEARFEYFIEQTSVPIYKVNLQGQISYANQALATLLHYDRDDLLSGKISEDQITPSNYQAIDASHIKDLRTNLVSNVWESERITAHGKKLTVGVTLRRLNEDLSDRIVFLLDLQEMRQLEDDLKQRQTVFSALVQEMPHIVFVSDTKGRMRQFNKRYYELTGATAAVDDGFGWRDMIHPSDLEKWDKRWQDAAKKNSSFSGEFRICAADGEYYWHIVRALPLDKPIEGQIEGLLEITVENQTDIAYWLESDGLWIGTATDIDRRKRLMEEVLESAHAFQSLADQIPQIVWTADPEGRVDFFSNRWFDFSGLTREHRVGLDFALFMHPDDRKEYMKRWRACVKTGDAFEADVRLKARREDHNGEDVYVKFLARAVALRNYRGGIAQWVGTWTSIN
jgi:PAS domain S-box-containing protein